MVDNVVDIKRKTGKIPSKILDAMKDVCEEYIILGVNKDHEFCYSINAESHGSAFQMLIIAGGNVYKDQFGAS